MTTTYGHRIGHYNAVMPRARTRSLPASLAILGAVTILISAWGAIIPYVGPIFGYSADGAPAWSWSLTHTVLALVPGALGVAAGAVIWARSSNLRLGGGRFRLSLAGLVAVFCGAWFVIGPFAWPVVDNTGGYFVPASPLRELADLVGYALGTGVILAACGAFALGWTVRHQRVQESAARPSEGVDERTNGRDAAYAPMEAGMAPGTPSPRQTVQVGVPQGGVEPPVGPSARAEEAEGGGAHAQR